MTVLHRGAHTHTPFVVEFTQSKCIFQDQLKRIIATGDLHSGLFLLRIQRRDDILALSPNFISQVAEVPYKYQSRLWQRRLGHSSLHTLKRIP